jgi:hypothetical protein
VAIDSVDSDYIINETATAQLRAQATGNSQ